MTWRLPSCTPADVERVLVKLGYVLHRQSGSHRIFKRDSDKKRVVVSQHSKALKRGTLHAIVKQAGVTPEEFAKLL